MYLPLSVVASLTKAEAEADALFIPVYSNYSERQRSTGYILAINLSNMFYDCREVSLAERPTRLLSTIH
jgi:hypothetical protein